MSALMKEERTGAADVSGPGAASVAQAWAQLWDLLRVKPDLREIGTHATRALEERQHVVRAFLGTAQRLENPLALGVRVASQIPLAQVLAAHAVVARDSFGGGIRQRQQQRRDETGAVLARDAVEQQRRGRRSRNEGEHATELGAHVIEHPALPQLLGRIAAAQPPFVLGVREERDACVAQLRQ